MNRDQIKGRGKEAMGKVQKEAGRLSGDTSTEAKGAAKEVAGKAQKTFGDTKAKTEH